MAFLSLMIRAMNKSFGSSTPWALFTESTTDSGGMRNCPARMKTEPQEKRQTKQAGMRTTPLPTAAPAVFRTHSAADYSNEIPWQSFSVKFWNVADSNVGSSDTIPKIWSWKKIRHTVQADHPAEMANRGTLAEVSGHLLFFIYFRYGRQIVEAAV